MSSGVRGGGFMNAAMQGPLKRTRATAYNLYNAAADNIKKDYGSAIDYWRPQYDMGQQRMGEFKNWLKDPNAITKDPSYQWRLNQGVNSIENSAAARGGLLSGNTARAITDYAQNSASQEYGNQFNRWLQEMGLGQNATGAISQLSAERGNALAGIRQRQGDQWFNNTMSSLQEIRQAEQGLNNIIQSWMPASFGSGKGGK